MPSIIGDSHKDYVKSQIKARQEILGKPLKSSEDIAWSNGKTSWVRLASSVDISDSQVPFYNFDEEKYDSKSNNGAEFRQEYLDLNGYEGNTLSKQLVLQGGALKVDSSKRFGVTNSTSNLPDSEFNYGYGGNDFGLKAIPGISDFSVKTNNKGSLRFATINITANNKRQFEYLETVYLRLGYTVLIEWGNSSYPYNNEGNIEYRQNRANLSQEFLNNSLTGQKATTYFYTEIERLRKETQGNYDGFLGKINNFSWSFTKGGTYEITLEVITIGSVVESLKLDVTYSDLILDKNGNPLPSEQQKNSLLTSLQAISVPPPEETTVTESGKPVLEVNLDVFARIGSFFDNLSLDDPKKRIEYPAITKDINTGKVDICRATFGKNSDLYTFIRFGKILDILNKHFLLQDSEENPVMIELDTSEDQYCFSNKLAISSDPDKVIIRQRIEDPEIGEFEIFDKYEEARIEPFHTTYEEVPVGSIMNLYFSLSYLESVIESLSETSDTSLTLSIYDFVKKLLDKASSSLGGLNKFNVRIVDKEFENGEVKEVLEFYDEVCPFEIEKLRNVKENDPVFTIYGFNGNEGGFATDYNFNTKLSKETSTMVAVGAQANGEAVGEDATLFSKWSLGLIDRILPQKLDMNSFIRGTDKATKSYFKLVRAYKNYLLLFRGTSLYKTATVIEEGANIELATPGLTGVGGNVEIRDLTIEYFGYGFSKCNLSAVKNEKSIGGFNSIQKQFFRKFYALEAQSKNSSTPFIGFLPASLSLTIDGLSGIRIFDKLKVDSRFLPPNYGNTLDFIITGLDHKIVNNKWETSVDTLSIPKSTKTLKLNPTEILTQFPPILTDSEDYVGYYSYDDSTLATIIAQSAKTITDRPGIGTGDDVVRNTNGNLTLPNEFFNRVGNRQLADEFQDTPLVSIGSVKNVALYRTATLSLSKATTSINQNAVDRNSSSSIRLLSQESNKKYYDGNYYLAKPAAEALLKFAKFLEENYPGKTFQINSAYRNYDHQNSLKSSDSSSKTAGAGSSAHGWGGAIDIQELIVKDPNKLDKDGNPSISSNPGLNSVFRGTNLDYEIWAEHAPKFGWYNPYRLRNGNFADEAWHWEFWGEPGQNIDIPSPKDPNTQNVGQRLILSGGMKATVPTLSKNTTLAFSTNTPSIYTDRKTGKPTTLKPENQ